MGDCIPTFEDVKEAAARFPPGMVTRTPVLTSRYLNEKAGLEIFFKCENLQRGLYFAEIIF